MEHVSSVRPTGKFPEKVENLKRWARFPGWNFPNGISCSIYTFLVLYTSFNCYQLGSHLSVPSGNGLSAVPEMEQLFTYRNSKKSIFVPTEISRFFTLMESALSLSSLAWKAANHQPPPSLSSPRPTTTATFRYQQYIVSRMVTRTDGVSNIIPSLDIILSYRLGTLISFSVSYRKNVAFTRNTNDVHLCRELDRRGKFSVSEQIYPVLQVNTNAFLSYVTCTMERISRDIPSALLSWPTI